MATITALPEGKWIMTFEVGSVNMYKVPVRDKIPNYFTTFGSIAGSALASSNSTVPVCSLYVKWSAARGRQGTIAVTASGDGLIFTNTNSGDVAS